MINPYAYFDTLFIGRKLQIAYEDFSFPEVHLLAYLSCLLSLYKAQTVSEWEYQFTVTTDGSPFAIDISTALEEMMVRGHIEAVGNYFKITTSGFREYEFLVSFTQNIARALFLEGACSSLLAVPIGLVRDALLNEPELGRAAKLSTTRALLEGPGLQLLHDHFAVLSRAIGVDTEDLMIPAVVWLTLLAKTAQSSKHSNGVRA